MIFKNVATVEKKKFAMKGTAGVEMQVLFGPEDGCPTFAMRKFAVEAGGYTPRHRHDFEHQVLVLSGEGVVYGNGKEQGIKAGDVLYVEANEVHQFKNNGEGVLEFLCLVPAFVHQAGAPMAVDCSEE